MDKLQITESKERREEEKRKKGGEELVRTVGDGTTKETPGLSCSPPGWGHVTLVRGF